MISAILLTGLTGCGSKDGKDGSSVNTLGMAGNKKTSTLQSQQSIPQPSQPSVAEMLQDSVAIYRAQAEELLPEVESLKKEFDSLNNKLVTDNGTEGIEKYRVLPGWKGYDPMSKSGIIARLLESGDIEIVATSTSGAFSSISLSAGGQSVSTGSVSSGSGLNYTVGNTTRVTFIGKEALNLCNFAKSHSNSTITLNFKGGSNSSVSLSKSQTEMLATFASILDAESKYEAARKKYMLAYNKMTFYDEEAKKLPTPSEPSPIN